MYYKLSKDYDALFNLISSGEIIAGFVDYSWDKILVSRDICKIQRQAPYEIRIGVRGMTYASLLSFNKEDGDEKDLFIAQCKVLNLEWIISLQADPASPEEGGQRM